MPPEFERLEEEEKWIKQHEQNLIEAARAKRKQEEEERIKKLCYMRCPKCGSELEEIEIEKVLIDRCKECEGIWLDKGELEKIRQGEEGERQKFFGKFMNLFK